MNNKNIIEVIKNELYYLLFIHAPRADPRIIRFRKKLLPVFPGDANSMRPSRFREPLGQQPPFRGSPEYHNAFHLWSPLGITLRPRSFSPQLFIYGTPWA